MIVDASGKEDAEQVALDRVQKEIVAAGGKVETVQKMGVKPFARVTAGRTGGAYSNIIFQGPPTALKELDAKFHLDTELFRWLITEVVEPKPRKPRKEPAAKPAATATK
jgi:ribosomal protein S6